jgi:hypothetical protein
MPMNCYMVQSTDPQNYNRVVGNPLWQAAMKKEYDSLLQNQTCNLVPPPPERNIFKCRWVHMIKRYKSRQVSKRLHQIHKYFYNFTKTFSEQKRISLLMVDTIIQDILSVYLKGIKIH